MDATHSAPIREAAAPNVPHPQPKSATILLLTSPNEFSAFSITKKKHKHIVTHEKLLSCFLKGKGGVISHIRYRAYEKQCEVQLGTVPALPARTHAGAIILFLFFSGEGEGG